MGDDASLSLLGYNPQLKPRAVRRLTSDLRHHNHVEPRTIFNNVDDVAGVAFRNLPQVVISEPGHLTAYDVLWARHVIFTSQTVSAVGGGHAYDVSKSDFVREEKSDFVREDAET